MISFIKKCAFVLIGIAFSGSVYAQTSYEMYASDIMTGKISTKGEHSLQVGTHSLYCKGGGVAAVPVLMGSKQCVSNPDIREN